MRMARTAYVNGDLVASDQARLFADDSGFERGDAVFSTLRVESGEPLDVRLHLDRLSQGLERVGITIPETRQQLHRALVEVAHGAPRPLARLRITVSRGRPSADATRVILANPYHDLAPESLKQGVVVVVVSERIDSRSPLCGIKSTSCQLQVLAGRRARRQSAWEGLLLNERERLVEGSRCNVIAQLDGRLLTPPLTDGCLPGTIRRHLLDAGWIEEGTICRRDLPRVGGMLLSNSLIGVVPVAVLDGRKLRPFAQLDSLRLQLQSLRERDS